MKAKDLCTIFLVVILATLSFSSYLQDDEAFDKVPLCFVFEGESISDDVEHFQADGLPATLEGVEPAFKVHALSREFNTTPQTPDSTRSSILLL